MQTLPPPPTGHDRKLGFRLRWRATLAPYPAPIRVAGFTLIELSIVLVIIGLIVGGVLVGQSLYQVAALQSLIRDLQNYEMAIRVFKDTYGGLPGDMTNATTFFPSSANGDGDGDMGIGLSAAYSNELDGFRAWQQLSLAELVNGSFTGVPGPGSNYDAVIGSNVPPAPLNSGITINAIINYAGDADYFPMKRGNFLSAGADSGIYQTFSSFLTAQQAYNIDLKLDGDLSPATGKIRNAKSSSSFVGDCTTTNDASTAQYNITNSEIACNLFYYID